MVVNLVMLNAVLFVIDVFTAGRGADGLEHHWIAEFFSCKLGAAVRPWDWWQLVTYGFIHSPYMFSHIFWNMVGLYMFGSSVEDRLGRTEFLRFYLGATFFGGLCWALCSLGMVNLPWSEKASLLFYGQWAQLKGPEPMLLGASGAIMGIIVLFALHNPQRIIMAMLLVPMPAWLLATIYVLMDLLGLSREFANNPDGYGVAYAAHLGGAAFGMAYFHYGWNLGRIQPGWLSFGTLKGMFKRRPSLKIHEPSKTEWDGDEAEVDRILEKISREGSNSLTDRERDILQHASRRYQRKRR